MRSLKAYKMDEIYDLEIVLSLLKLRYVETNGVNLEMTLKKKFKETGPHSGFHISNTLISPLPIRS